MKTYVDPFVSQPSPKASAGRLSEAEGRIEKFLNLLNSYKKNFSTRPNGLGRSEREIGVVIGVGDS